MARILALDYGTKRTGIAVTDSLQITANALDTVATKELFNFLRQYFQREEVEELVVGMPLNLDMTHTDATDAVCKLVEKLKKSFTTLKITTVDERFTSKMAFDTILQSGISKKQRRNKALVDKISATIILQYHLETKRNTYV